MKTLFTYLLDLAKQTLEPLDMWSGEYGGIRENNADKWRERRVVIEVKIPVNESTKKMLENYLPYYQVSELTFKLYYFKEDNHQGSWWVKE